MYNRVLITGGCGFIGSNFIRLFLKKYPKSTVINLDALTYAGNPENLKDVGGNYAFVLGNICDRTIVDQLVKGCDAVINFAAESHVDRSIADAKDFIKTNIVGTYILLEAAKKHKIKRFVQVSTDEVYGSLEVSNQPSKEIDRLKPRSPYSSSKAAADLIALAYYETYNLPVIITRSSNNYGPYQYPEKLMPLFITNLIEGKKVPLMGNGENIRDWIYVDDNCNAILTILEKGKEGEVYNVGGECEKTNKGITKEILKAFRKDDSWIQEIPHRLGHDFRYSLDCSKTKSLGWSHKTSFESGIQKTIQWYKDNQEWWKRLKDPENCTFIKKVSDERGFLVEFLTNHELQKKEFQQIYLVTLGPKVIRGNHYHKIKTEWMGCLIGRIKVTLKNIKTKQKQELILDSNHQDKFQRIEIKPYTLHSFENISNSKSGLVVYSDHVYNKEDTDTYEHINIGSGI